MAYPRGALYAPRRTSRSKNGGFTLIELSIVLVIIGLIIGGILVGQELVSQAGTRATIAQIEKYNAAVNTFYGKFGGVPGDLTPTLVSQLGFAVVPAASRPGNLGGGDGNGLLDNALSHWNPSQYQACCTSGETYWFWVDLSSNSGLINQTFNYTSAFPASITNITTPAINAIIPAAKIGNGNYVTAYSQNNKNYFGVTAITSLDNNGAVYGNPGFTPLQAFSIDKKIDDGLPQSGYVTAQYQAWNVASWTGLAIWAAGPGVLGPSDTSATSQSSTTCYDNRGVGGATQQYSMGSTASGGTNPNCGISFQMQGAAR